MIGSRLDLAAPLRRTLLEDLALRAPECLDRCGLISRGLFFFGDAASPARSPIVRSANLMVDARRTGTGGKKDGFDF